MFKRVIPLLLALTLMLGLGAYWLLYYTGNNTEFAKGHRYLVTIKPGMTTADIADLLHKKHLVKTPEAFRMEARLRGLAGNVKFTVPEGFNVVKTGRKLEAEGLGDAKKFEEAARNYTPYPYMETKNPDVIFKAEGFIFPTTYQLDPDMTEKDILALMVRTFNTEMNRENIPALAREKNMNLRDLINLAAMVELEAVYPEEQARIAGVFLKRLHIYMPIQSDTTIQYLLGTQKEEVTIADTRIKSPYNTYQNPGLPPGPIASPGIDAIKACLNPEATEYLYFVAEKDGHHRFTKTYGEHLKAIADIHKDDTK